MLERATARAMANVMISKGKVCEVSGKFGSTRFVRIDLKYKEPPPTPYTHTHPVHLFIYSDSHDL